MKNLIKLQTPLQNQPMSYILTLHKQRLDPYYKKINTSFINEFQLAKVNKSLCIHMDNLILTYGLETIEYYITTFFTKKVG